MRRLLTALVLAFCTLVLAAPAHADREGRGERWRDQQQGEGDRGNRDRDRRPSREFVPPDSYPQRKSDDGYRRPRFERRRQDDAYRRPWYERRRQDGYRPPWFERRRQHDRVRDRVVRGRMISLEELENRIARRAPGRRIGNPELLNYGGRSVYRIRWRMPDGHILIVFADAETGDVLEIRGR
jgi:hypothetical protein